MNPGLRTPLLVSSPNAGGVLLVDAGGIERLSAVDTTGVAKLPDGWLWARQSDDSNRLRRIADGSFASTALADHPLDLHDVLWHDGHVYAVSTELNAVLQLDAGLREVQRWTLAGERDSAHLNSICFHEGRLLGSRFGTSDRRHGYKGATRGAGQVIDVASGEVLLRGLSQPHSLTSHDDVLWLCDSEAYTLRAYRNFAQVAEHVLAGYARGLAFGAGGDIHVGLSRSRNDPDSPLRRARIVVLDADTLDHREEIDLPVDEIYDLRVFEGDRGALRAAALAEANEEIASLAHKHEVIEAELIERDGRLGALNGQLEALHVAHAAAQTHVGELLRRATDQGSELADVRASAQERRAWIEMLEPEAERLWQALETDERLIAMQSASMNEWRRAAESLLASRSWRYTRPMRRVSALLGRPAEIEAPPILDEAFESALTQPRASRAAVPIFGLAFAEDAEPVVSIVVTAFGNFDTTLACLRSIGRFADTIRHEVILIEDCSGDAEMERFHSVPGLRYVANAHNLGFLRSANQARHLARGQYIHFLNNDTLVRAGWLDALLLAFARFHDCGLVGSRLVYPDGSQQEAGGIVWSDGTACNFGRSDDPSRPAYQYAREVDYVSGASILLRADVFRHLEGFDERYAPAYYEDTDLAFRIRGLGLKAYFQPSSEVVHLEGVSHGTDPGAGVKACQERNRATFVDRWRETLQREQLPPGAHAFLARDRAQLRKTVLVVDRTAPRTDRDAGSRAIWQLMRVLHLQGMSIKFWSQEADAAEVYVQNLQAHGIELLHGGGDADAFDAWIAENGGYLDYVVLSRPTVAEAHIDAVRRHSAAKVLYYGHDIHYLRFVSQRRIDPDPDLGGFAHHARLVEEGLWGKSDAILYPADGETEHVRQWLSDNHVEARAETIPLFAYEPMPLDVGAGLQHRRNVLFVGGFAHAPNEDGALWFARHVWPIVHRACPDCRLCLVGADPTDAVASLGRSDVLVTGYIPEHELVAYYHSARVVAAPLRFGAGMKGKVLEAMRYGVPCVTTSIGAQGLATAGFLRVSDDVQETAKHVIDLIRNDEAWMQAAQAGLAFIAEEFSVESVWRVLSDLVDATPYPDVDSRCRSIEAS